MHHFILAISITLFTQNLIHGQCYPDRHSTNWFDGWISCEPAPNPNGSLEKSHWIMYDFGEVYKLGKTTIWNTNDPSHLDWGMRDVRIEVSTDGVAWTSIGTYTFEQASGLSTYEGFAGPDLGGVEAKYLLVTGMSNWDGECYGFSEIRIAAEEVIVSSVSNLSENTCFTLSASPNPFTVDTDVEIVSRCPEPFDYSVIDVLGRVVKQGEHSGEIGTVKMKMNLAELPQGTYYLRVQQVDNSAQLTLVKFNRS